MEPWGGAVCAHELVRLGERMRDAPTVNTVEGVQRREKPAVALLTALPILWHYGIKEDQARQTFRDQLCNVQHDDPAKAEADQYDLSNSQCARCTLSPSPVNVGAKAQWLRLHSRTATGRHSHPPPQPP